MLGVAVASVDVRGAAGDIPPPPEARSVFAVVDGSEEGASDPEDDDGEHADKDNASNAKIAGAAACFVIPVSLGSDCD